MEEKKAFSPCSTLRGRQKKIAREARELNKKSVGCIVANLCGSVADNNKKNPLQNPN